MQLEFSLLIFSLAAFLSSFFSLLSSIGPQFPNRVVGTTCSFVMETKESHFGIQFPRILQCFFSPERETLPIDKSISPAQPHYQHFPATPNYVHCSGSSQLLEKLSIFLSSLLATPCKNYLALSQFGVTTQRTSDESWRNTQFCFERKKADRVPFIESPTSSGEIGRLGDIGVCT